MKPALLRGAMGVASQVLPRHRRWRALLRSCTLTPDAVEEPTGHRNVVICGCPRSGTALVTAALFQPPTMVTVMEPWDGMRLPPAQLFESVRAELAEGTLRRGRLRVDLVKEGRVAWQHDGERSFPVDYDAASTIVGVKWPAYWQLLGRLPDTAFIVCIRDPAEVVTSFERTTGRLSSGLEYDIAFNRALNSALLAEHKDDESRRIALFDAANERILQHLDDDNVCAVRYEQWAADPAGLLSEISAFLNADVTGSAIDIRPSPPVEPDRAAEIRARSRTAAALGYR